MKDRSVAAAWFLQLISALGESEKVKTKASVWFYLLARDGDKHCM